MGQKLQKTDTLVESEREVQEFNTFSYSYQKNDQANMMKLLRIIIEDDGTPVKSDRLDY